MMIIQSEEDLMLLGVTIDDIQIHKLRSDVIFMEDLLKDKRRTGDSTILSDEAIRWCSCYSPMIVCKRQEKLELISGLSVYVSHKANGYKGEVIVFYMPNLEEDEIRKIIVMDDLFGWVSNNGLQRGDNRRFIERIIKISLSTVWRETLEHLFPELIRSDSNLARFLGVSRAYVCKTKQKMHKELQP